MQESQKGEFRSRLINIERRLCHQAKSCYLNSLRGTRTMFLGPKQAATIGQVGGIISSLLSIATIITANLCTHIMSISPIDPHDVRGTAGVHRQNDCETEGGTAKAEEQYDPCRKVKRVSLDQG